MTRRERLENKLAKREAWAQSASAKSSQRFDAARSATEGIPFGQPILVGHHSEKRHRGAIARSDAHMRKACELSDKAEHHTSKAAGLEAQLDKSIFSDDADAIAQLESRIAEREQECEQENAINKAWRKGKAAGVIALLGEESARKHIRTMELCPWLRGPCFSTNTRASIRRDKKRIEDIKYRMERQKRAEANGGVIFTQGGEYCTIAFAEKPDRSVLDALKQSGFYWSSGAWHGRIDAIPQAVKNMVPSNSPTPTEGGA